MQRNYKNNAKLELKYIETEEFFRSCECQCQECGEQTLEPIEKNGEYSEYRCTSCGHEGNIQEELIDGPDYLFEEMDSYGCSDEW